MADYENGPWELGSQVTPDDFDGIRRGCEHYRFIDHKRHGEIALVVWCMEGEKSSPDLEAHANRIVASLNACAGIDIVTLVDGGFSIKGLSEHASTLEKRVASLVEAVDALEEFSEAMECASDWPDTTGDKEQLLRCVTRARQLLENVRGKL